jgi:tRNA U34 2-thiouridine synthase MnmA/TrmU
MEHLHTKDTWMATGHYARKGWDDRGPTLLRARDSGKDQSYYLSGMPKLSLARTLFPLGGFTKPEVRALAKEYQLPTAERPESMGICFVGEKRRFSDFISESIRKKATQSLSSSRPIYPFERRQYRPWGDWACYGSP